MSLAYIFSLYKTGAERWLKDMYLQLTSVSWIVLDWAVLLVFSSIINNTYLNGRFQWKSQKLYVNAKKFILTLDTKSPTSYYGRENVVDFQINYIKCM